jgi:hypothetical protein
LAVIDPDVSKRIMKYGLAGEGHCAGSALRHAAGSACARGAVKDRAAATAVPQRAAVIPKERRRVPQRKEVLFMFS